MITTVKSLIFLPPKFSAYSDLRRTFWCVFEKQPHSQRVKALRLTIKLICMIINNKKKSTKHCLFIDEYKRSKNNDSYFSFGFNTTLHNSLSLMIIHSSIRLKAYNCIERIAESLFGNFDRTSNNFVSQAQSKCLLIIKELLNVYQIWCDPRRALNLVITFFRWALLSLLKRKAFNAFWDCWQTSFPVWLSWKVFHFIKPLGNF